jgi:hypothetical protein
LEAEKAELKNEADLRQAAVRGPHWAVVVTQALADVEGVMGVWTAMAEKMSLSLYPWCQLLLVVARMTSWSARYMKAAG